MHIWKLTSIFFIHEKQRIPFISFSIYHISFMKSLCLKISLQTNHSLSISQTSCFPSKFECILCYFRILDISSRLKKTCKFSRVLMKQSMIIFQQEYTYFSKSDLLILITSTGVAHFAEENLSDLSSRRLPSPKKSPCLRIWTNCPFLVWTSTFPDEIEERMYFCSVF